MPKGENEAFKEQQGRFSRISKEELREAQSRGGKARTMTMNDMKRRANEIDAEEVSSGMKGEVLLRNIQNRAAHGDMKAAKLWFEIKQFGEPKSLDITSGGAPLPSIEIIGQEGGMKIARSESEIET